MKKKSKNKSVNTFQSHFESPHPCWKQKKAYSPQYVDPFVPIITAAWKMAEIESRKREIHHDPLTACMPNQLAAIPRVLEGAWGTARNYWPSTARNTNTSVTTHTGARI